MSIENEIIRYLKRHIEATPNEIGNELKVSRQLLHRVLNRLQDEQMIEKIGRPPKVFYRLKAATVVKSPEAKNVSEADRNFMDAYFNLFSETGEEFIGLEAFIKWCAKQKLPLQKTINEFITTRKKYLSYFGKNHFIDGTEKLRSTKGFDRVCIDKMYYNDFYAIERFGKTMSGNLLHFAKQGQSKHLMEKVADSIKEKLNDLIAKEKIDAVGFIPPTIKRDVQIMHYLQKALNISLPHIVIKKVSGKIPIPQKALSKLDDRISNARSSIVVDDKRIFKRILLIDDAVGSGSTINETACKIKLKRMAKEVIGFAVVGSFKGFEVLQEI